MATLQLARTISQLRKEQPAITLILARNKNQNLVVYEAVRNEQKTVLQGLKAYWLDLEPELQAQHRAQGHKDYKADFAVWDHYAYGFTYVPVTALTGTLTLKQAPQFPLQIQVAPSGMKTYYTEGGTTLEVSHVYVQAQEGLTPLTTKVQFLELQGINVQTQQPQSLRHTFF